MSGNSNSIRRRLLAADSLLMSSLCCHAEILGYSTSHHLLIDKINDGFFEAALNDLEQAGRRLEPDGKALPSEFWRLTAAIATDLGMADRAADLRSRA